MKPTEYFRQWLEARDTPCFAGQIVILPGYELRHADDRDAPQGSLGEISCPEGVLEVVGVDAEGNFRPVRGFGNLVRGWRLPGLRFADLVRALELVYPLAIAHGASYLRGEIRAVEFRETAARQTGMYRLTQTISDGQLRALTRQECDARCLRKRLWQPEKGEGMEVSRDVDSWPLVCPEACNYLVAKAREMIKGEH